VDYSLWMSNSVHLRGVPVRRPAHPMREADSRTRPGKRNGLNCLYLATAGDPRHARLHPPFGRFISYHRRVSRIQRKPAP
jgi:hypothetical protein